jgi:hypothetical protein
MASCGNIGRRRAFAEIYRRGSPGTRWMSRKTTETTGHRTGTVYKDANEQ